MRIRSLLMISGGLVFSLPAGGFHANTAPAHYAAPRQAPLPAFNIVLLGMPSQNDRVRRWLAQIADVPKGRQTLARIEASGHTLTIVHTPTSLVSSGRTAAPMSADLINGRGESVEIFFNFNIPDSGSHLVFDTRRRPIEYTAIQNLYHELAHAMHMMNGTWRYANSERQAIEEENVFRRQLAETRRRTFYERVYVSGVPICPERPDLIDVSWQQNTIC